LYAKLISRRISVIGDPLLNEEQIGFRRGRFCMDSILTFQQLIEGHREYDIETHLLFTDCVQVFGTIL
jgi:hypothetical protein